MVAIKNLFFLITAASALILPRDYTTVLNDLKKGDADTRQLTSLVNAYTGSGSQTLQIRSQITTIKNDISQASSDIDASATPTAAQGQTILDYINNTLIPDIKTDLTAVKNKRTTFTNAGVKGEVLQNLKDLKAALDTAANKLIAKAPTSSLKSGGTTAKNNLDAAFNDAISYYS